MDFTDNRLITLGESNSNTLSELCQDNGIETKLKTYSKKGTLPPMDNAPKLPPLKTVKSQKSVKQTSKLPYNDENIENLPETHIVVIEPKVKEETQKKNTSKVIVVQNTEKRKLQRVQTTNQQAEQNYNDPQFDASKRKPIVTRKEYENTVVQVTSKIEGIEEVHAITRKFSWSKLNGCSSAIDKPIPENIFINGTLSKYRNLIGSLSKVQFSFGIGSSLFIGSQKTSNSVFESSKHRICSSNLQTATETEHAVISGNYFGSLYNIYTPEADTKKGTEKSLEGVYAPKSVIATIRYKSPPLFNLDKTRQVEVYIRHPIEGINLINEFDEQTKQPRNLEDLYSYQVNKNRIIKLVNKLPKVSPKTGKFVLNFHGLCDVDSVHNFILYDEKDLKQNDVFIMGKSKKDCYKVRIAHPLCMRVGTGIVLSSLDFKWFCQ